MRLISQGELYLLSLFLMVCLYLLVFVTECLSLTEP